MNPPPAHNRAALVIVLVLIASISSACTTSMTYATHPKTLEPGEVQAGVVMQADVNSSPLTQTRETIERRIDEAQGGELSEEDFRDVLDMAVSWLLFRPGVSTEASMRVGLVDGLDAGIRYNGSTTKLDLKGRLWQSEDETQVLSLTGGVGRQSGAVSTILEHLAMSEFSRWDADVALMYGTQPAQFVRLYLGPRFVYSWLNAEPRLDSELRNVIPEEYEDYDPSQYFHDANVAYFGGTGGMMIGYEWIWLTLEATVMRMAFEPQILDQRRDLSGWMVAPVGGLMFEF